MLVARTNGDDEAARLNLLARIGSSIRVAQESVLVSRVEDHVV